VADKPSEQSVRLNIPRDFPRLYNHSSPPTNNRRTSTPWPTTTFARGLLFSSSSTHFQEVPCVSLWSRWVERNSLLRLRAWCHGQYQDEDLWKVWNSPYTSTSDLCRHEPRGTTHPGVP
jgi:hypothetical protein